MYQLQYSGGTIVLFASVLIVPIMFISEDISNLLVLLADIVAFSLLLSHRLGAEAYHWNHTNLLIFSTIGLLLGHFVNKSRFERYRFAEAASKLADLQTRYAYQDPMTGLGNRRAYSEKIDGLAAALPADCWFVMADINGLKAANDTLGHEAGDELIVGAAECLRRSFAGVDTIYRIGGDEFCVLARGPAADAEESLKRLETVSAAWKGRFIDGISLSCGLASSQEFADLDDLLKAADQRMYAAKRDYYIRSGKDRRQR